MNNIYVNGATPNNIAVLFYFMRRENYKYDRKINTWYIMTCSGNYEICHEMYKARLFINEELTRKLKRYYGRLIKSQPMDKKRLTEKYLLTAKKIHTVRFGNNVINRLKSMYEINTKN
jgi:uncharacterized protein YllA (UPF0747 family)